MAADSRPAPPASEPANRADRTLGLAASGLALIAVTYGLARFAYGLFVPAFRAAFDLDGTTVGAIASGSYAAYCVGVLAAATLTPRLGARTVAVGAGALATVGTALIGLAPDPAVLAVGVVVAGSSTGAASPPLAHAVARTVAPVARDRVQTVVNSGTGLGVLVSGPVALVAQDRWRAAWLAFAAIAAVVTVWAARTVPSARDGGPTAPRGTPSSALTVPPGTARLLLASATLGAGTAATWTFGQDLLTTVGNQSRTSATVAWIALGACGLLGAAAGDLVGRLGLRVGWVVTMLGLGLATVALAVFPHLAVAAVVASGLFGALYIVLTAVLLLWGTRVFDGRPSLGVGLAFLLLAVGQAVAAPLLGALADRTDLTTAFWAAAVLAVVGCLAAPTGRTALL